MKKGETPAQDKIKKEEFEKLCGLQCTIDEVCAFFDVEDDTLNRWCKKTYGCTFSEVFKVKRGIGKISLRRYQMNLAKKNAAMAIFLGKNYLGQKDKVEVVDNSTVNVGIQNIADLLNNPAKERTEEDFTIKDE